jgi:hypothetical protein
MKHSVLRRLSLGAVIALAVASVFSAIVAFPMLSSASPAVSIHGQGKGHPTIRKSVKNDVSPKLSAIPGAPEAGPREAPDDGPELDLVHQGRANKLKAYEQTKVGSSAAPSLIYNFDGLGQGFTGPQGTMQDIYVPPDTNGIVGPKDYVQIVNADFAIFNKDSSRGAVGTVRYGPVAINTLWSGFGGLCQADNNGDPVVTYDSIADRWVISQFAVSNPDPYFYQCVAVSTTSDPTGSYYRYSFQYSNFPDYPKMGLWPDGYYITYNLFNASGTAFLGAQDCALNRAQMVTGAPATQVCFTTSTSYGSLLPATLDGATQPPAGSPNYAVALNTYTSLGLWKFHVDWTTPANSTFTGPTSIAVPSYSEACGGGTCIAQAGQTQQLDSLGDRLMYRLAYRNFGGYESLVVDHSIVSGGTIGMRWYELRSPNATPTLYQSGSYTPDTTSRWMGSIAQDQSGDMAMGFSTSSSSVHPGISVTGRLAGDPLGQMTQGETSLIVGAGSQKDYSRWGDYSAMTVDPADGCTFWYTNEYIPSDGSFNWKTRIGAFKYPSCGAAPTNDFSISANPTSLSIPQGSSNTATISTAVTSGSAATISLSAGVSPSGPTASLNPTSVTAGGSSTLTVNVGAAVTPGAYTVTVTGTEGSAIHSAMVNVTVTASGGGGFNSGTLGSTISSGPVSISTNAHSGGSSIQIGASTQYNGDASLSQTFTVATGYVSVSFWYELVCTGSASHNWMTATLRDNTSKTTATMLGKTCARSAGWTPVAARVTAGHSYTMTIVVHADGQRSHPAYAFVDDTALAAAAPRQFVRSGLVMDGPR